MSASIRSERLLRDYQLFEEGQTSFDVHSVVVSGPLDLHPREFDNSVGITRADLSTFQKV